MNATPSLHHSKTPPLRPEFGVRAVSGIWQTVWLEAVPGEDISALKITPDVDNQTLRLTVDAATAGQVIATASDGRNTVAVAWQTGPAPFGHRMPGTRTDWTSADIWIRREFQVSGKIPNRLNLLVKHHEDAEIYLNGILAGKVNGSADDYKTVPMSTEAQASLKPGRNVIAAHCHNSVGSQGIDVGIAKAGQPQGSRPAK